ncbi:hypothetical protein C8R43DRAFT_1134948 [Mycena crocata]|nr:hypothetical protein C8R43DRAFT_1134948 [Mycena crocata]
MFSKLVSVVLLTALAGRALGADKFNVTIGKTVVLAKDVLGYTSGPLTAACDTGANCTSARAAIAACGDEDAACFCTKDLTDALKSCEQCLFAGLIAANKPAPDPRAGSNVALGGWTDNCDHANQTLAAPLALVVPDNWDGPFVSVFPEPVGIVIAITGGILGSSLIYMLCNM